MNVLCAGINHQVAPVGIREHFAVQNHEMPRVLEALRSMDPISEAVVLSTCNRVEIYAASMFPEQAMESLCGFLIDRAGIDAPLYHHDMPHSIRHLYRVASGLDSMVLGETEILGQVKKAYAAASDAGMTSRTLNKLFQSAFRVAKSVRSQTRITHGATSVGAAAVELAGRIFGDLHQRRVMVLGAGDTSERTARSLVSRGVRTVIVSNRSFDRAATLAAEIGGLAIHFEQWSDEFHDIDILISSTAAPRPIVTPERLEPMMRLRPGRPLFLIDLAVPRDIDPAVNRIDNVFLYDIDSLQSIASQSLAIRRREIEHCESIIDAGVADYLGWLRRASPALSIS